MEFPLGQYIRGIRFGGILGRRWMLFGVDMKDIFAPALAKAMES
jgi:hypothetical protein